MSVKLDLAILELVCSRLCHDLVGPVGAATNGIELLREIQSNQNADILDMTDDSARTAWRRLEFFRVAFGYGGGRNGWSEPELIALATGMLKDSRVTLDWPQSGSPSITGRGAKLLLNVVFLIAEALPRGGQVSVGLASHPDYQAADIVGRGQGATLHPRIISTVTGQVPPGELDSRVILAHLAFLQAQSVEADVGWDFGQDEIRAQIKLPTSELAVA